MSLSVSLYLYIYHVRIQDRGQLPDFICKIFDKDSKGNSPSREFKRTIINNLFVKQADGSLRMDLDNNIIVEARSQIERTEGQEAVDAGKSTKFYKLKDWCVSS